MKTKKLINHMISEVSEEQLKQIGVFRGLQTVSKLIENNPKDPVEDQAVRELIKIMALRIFQLTGSQAAYSVYNNLEQWSNRVNNNHSQ